MTSENKKDPKASATTKETSRRKLLKATAAGGGVAIGLNRLPDEWGKPVIDTVVLPAHAVTSVGGLSDPCGSEIIPTGRTTWNVRVTGFVQGEGDLANIEIVINGQHGSESDQANTNTNSNGSYSAIIGEFSCAGGSGTVNVTVTSTDPRLAGQSAECPVSASKCARSE